MESITSDNSLFSKIVLRGKPSSHGDTGANSSILPEYLLNIETLSCTKHTHLCICSDLLQYPTQMKDYYIFFLPFQKMQCSISCIPKNCKNCFGKANKQAQPQITAASFQKCDGHIK